MTLLPCTFRALVLLLSSSSLVAMLPSSEADTTSSALSLVQRTARDIHVHGKINGQDPNWFDSRTRGGLPSDASEQIELSNEAANSQQSSEDDRRQPSSEGWMEADGNQPSDEGEKIWPAHLIEHTGKCKQQMADIMARMEGEDLTDAVVQGEDWIMSQAMFEFLGSAAKDELTKSDSKAACSTSFKFGIVPMAFLCLGGADEVRTYNLHGGEHLQKAAGLVDELYPGKSQYIQGDLRDFIGVYGWGACHVSFVGGGRDYEAVSQDILNFAKLSDKDALLIVDGCNNKESAPRKAFDNAQTAGLIQDAMFYSDFPGFTKKVCLGRFTGDQRDEAYEGLTQSRGILVDRA